MKVRGIVLVMAGIGLLAFTASADDWPQWRGPQRNAISKEKGLLKEWPKSGPRLVWQVKDVGQGYSTPAVVGPSVYLLGNEGLDDEFVQARSVSDGAKVWTTRIGKVGNPKQKPPYPGTRSTPTVDGDVLYALGSDGDLACLDLKTGKPRWQKSLRTEFDGKPGTWAYSESPLVDGDVLVCSPGGAKATIVALNKKTGELLWQTPVPGGDAAAYASPIPVEVEGTRQYVQFLAKGLVGVDAKSGKFLWRYEQTAQDSPANIQTPVAVGNHVFSATGKGGSGLIKLTSSASPVEKVYYSKKLPGSIGGVVVLGDSLYGTNSRGLMCVEFATGTVKWQEETLGAGALCYADGNLYFHGENGQVALIEATPTAYRERGRFTPPDQPNRGKSKAWTYPVVANGKLYLRDFDMLWCYDVASGK